MRAAGAAGYVAKPLIRLQGVPLVTRHLIALSGAGVDEVVVVPRLVEPVLGELVGLEPVLVLVNAQQFTKTANCWGVTNNSKGTNTNRVVLLRKRD